MNNTQQVSTTSYPNNWDNGYPSGGNYWSDYNGTDLYGGPYQNITSSDGIGDTPYIINAKNQDKYPLINLTTTDFMPPTTLDDYDGLWHTTNFTITLTATDDSSGVAETYYKINDEPTKTVSTYGQPLITTEGTNNTLEYWSIDIAGNEESHHVLTEIKLDKTTPAGSVTINNDATYTNSTSVTLALTASDDTSGVYQVRYSNDGVWDTEPLETPTPTKTWTLTSGDGTKTVYYQIKDNAGLVSTTYSDTIILDTTAPVIEIPSREPSGGVQSDQPVKISVNVTDVISHVKNVTLCYSLNNGTTWEQPLPMALNSSTNLYEATIPGQQAGTWVKYKIVAYDFAENIATLEGTQPYFVYQVIPEFLQVLILPIFIITTLIAVILCRKNKTQIKMPLKPQNLWCHIWDITCWLRFSSSRLHSKNASKT